MAIDGKRISILDNEVSRLHGKYGKINGSCELLEDIAFKEYDVITISRSSGAGVPHVLYEWENGKHVICYGASFSSAKPIWLGHEIGHLAAKHFEAYFGNHEAEANYFSRKINGLSKTEFYTKVFLDVALSFFLYAPIHLLPSRMFAEYLSRHAVKITQST